MTETVADTGMVRVNRPYVPKINEISITNYYVHLHYCTYDYNLMFGLFEIVKIKIIYI